MKRKPISRKQAAQIFGNEDELDWAVDEVQGLGVIAFLDGGIALRVLRDCGKQYFVLDKDDCADGEIQDVLDALESGLRDLRSQPTFDNDYDC
jgi:hypothetical protein